MARLPVIVCIDVEPDLRVPDAPSPAWTGFERAAELFDAFRPPGARFSWFLRMDPQVAELHGDAAWVARRYGHVLAGLAARGDELGLHVHGWKRHDGRWVTPYHDGRWIAHCVRSSFEAFAGAFGRPCASFRGGDGWVDEEASRVVEELGARFDLTLEPGVVRDDLPRAPYHPSAESLARPGGRGIEVIPVSTGRTSWGSAVRGPSPPAARPEGYVDRSSGDELLGWARDVATPSSRVTVEILEAGRPVGRAQARAFRRDLQEAGKGDGRHAWRWLIPPSLRDGRPHELRVEVGGVELTGSPVTVRSPPGAADPWVALNLSLDPLAFGLMIDPIIAAAGATPYLAVVMRSDAPASPEQREAVEANLALLRAREVAFVTPAER